MFYLKLAFCLILHFSSARKINETNSKTSFGREPSNLHDFRVDYDHGVFVKDSKPFRYVAGGIHYFRMLPHYWEDRLMKAKSCGLDAIEMYIPWNYHQPKSNIFDFKSRRDVVKFINLAQKHNLLVIVRGFPYADTEWDMGGLPYWLLSSSVSNQSDPIKLRTTDKRFIGHVYNWFSVIMPKLKPLLYKNGGPIIMVQIENEYGSYGGDKTYLGILFNIIHKFLGDSVVYFTTDGNSVQDLSRGQINGTLQTCDFGAGQIANKSFAALVKTLPKGPHVNSEYYTGWLDHWGETHHRLASTTVVNSLVSMLKFNASVNFYMFHGGTNFEYWAGSNSGNHQITTSYDYDAPLNEAGDTTSKYFDIKNAISTYKDIEKIPVPKNSTKMTYGPIQMKNIGNIFDYLDDISARPVRSTNPLSYEDLESFGGYVLYEAQLSESIKNGPVSLVLSNGMKDIAQLFVNRQTVGGTINYGEKILNFTLSDSSGQPTLSLLVRSRGRVCYGGGIYDIKGIYGNVSLSVGDAVYTLQNWTHYPIRLENFYTLKQQQVVEHPDSYLKIKKSSWKPLLPSLYVGKLSVERFHDTFVDMSDGGWRSGYVVINGFNLGYFEPKSGPQLTLYAPLPGINTEMKGREKSINILIFESEPKYDISNIFLTETHNIG